MKTTLAAILFLLLALTNVEAQTGNATIFDYDANGQRVLRYLEPLATLNKFGDTLTKESPPDTINRLLPDLNNKHIVVKAYPNPVANELIIENLTWDVEHTATVKVFDITGKFIQSRTITTALERLPLSSVAPGTYQVHYYLDGELLTTWKIIKQ